MKRLAYALALIPSLAFAQAAPAPAPTIAEVTENANDLIGSLRQQLIAANDQIAQLGAKIAKSGRDLEAAKKELADMKAKTEPPKDAPK